MYDQPPSSSGWHSDDNRGIFHADTKLLYQLLSVIDTLVSGPRTTVYDALDRYLPITASIAM